MRPSAQGLGSLRRAAVVAVILAGSYPFPAAAADLPQMQPEFSFRLRDTAAATRTIADVEVLPDGRIALVDFQTHRVALFDAGGRFERFLSPPPGVSPEETLVPRLVALADGGLVLFDDAADRFLFYDRRLRPAAAVSLPLELHSLNGLARHPLGDLFAVAFCMTNNKIVHRFDGHGEYRDSFVEAIEVPQRERGISTGQIAVDPFDGTLWLSRTTPYEILHLTTEGEVLDRITRDLPGFEPPSMRSRGEGVLEFPGGPFSASVKIAVLGEVVVNSYVLADGTRGADAFRRDGTLLAAGLGSDAPQAFAKRVGNGLYVRHFNGGDPRVELWRARP